MRTGTGSQIKRRNWLVAYTVPEGDRRAIMTSNDDPLSKDLLLIFEDWLRFDAEVPRPEALIFSIQPLDTFWTGAEEEDNVIE